MWYERLWDEQKLAADFVIDRLQHDGGAGLFSEQGTGKTIISLAVIEELWPAQLIIVCPLNAVELTWVPRLRELPQYVVCRTLDEVKSVPPGKSRCLVIHNQAWVKDINRLRKHPWDMMILDESQCIKQRSSGWSRAARKMRHVRRRLALSGTPIDKSPIDVYGQMRFIDHEVLDEDWGPFAEQFCYRGGYKNKQWKFDNAKLPSFLARLERHIYRLSADFLKLPPMTINLLPVDLLGKQRRVYDEMSRENLVEVDGITIKADLPITRLAKLEQIACGFIMDEDGKVHDVGRAKMRKLEWLMNQIEPPAVVCCKFREDIDRICDTLYEGTKFISNAVVSGGTKDERVRYVEDFQAGKLDALVVQVRTGGVSIEFTRSCQMVIYSMGHSFIDFDQLIKRIRRYGQDREQQVYLIYAANTVDEEKIDAVERKAQDANLVVKHFEREVTMAKTATKKTTAKKATKKTAASPAYKYGIAHAAKYLGVTEPVARAKFRNAGVEKSGASYGWDSEAAMHKDADLTNKA